MAAALGALPRDRAGSGSGLLMTVRQVGSAIGIALLGSLLASAYSDRLDTSGLPERRRGHRRATPWSAPTSSPTALGDRALAASANAAYVHGMSLVLLVSGIAALVTALLAAALLPNGRGRPSTAGPPGHPERTPTDGPGPRRCRTMSPMAATAHSSTSAAEPQLGLRERKKIKTRIAIRDATYRLIKEQGYDATTIEQIAEARRGVAVHGLPLLPDQGGHRPHGRVRPDPGGRSCGRGPRTSRGWTPCGTC